MAACMQNYPEHWNDFAASTRLSLIIGKNVSAFDYIQSQRMRTRALETFAGVFQAVDVIATPVAPEVAFALGARLEDPLAMYLADLYTVTAALAGLPAIALPAGLADGLPVGFQLMGRPLEDVRLLEVAHAFQQVTDHHRQAPDL